VPECFVFDVVRNARRAAAGAPSLPRSTQPDPLLALDAEHREALAVFKAIGSGNPELEAVGDLQTELVDKLVNTPATSLEGVLVKAPDLTASNVLPAELRAMFEEGREKFMDGLRKVGLPE